MKKQTKEKNSRKIPSPPKKTKILAVGDIHGDTGLVKRLAERAEKENVDLVILAGDLTLANLSTENLIGPFAKAKKQVLIIPGNHEDASTIDFLTNAYENTKNLHGYYFKRQNLGIFGAGGANFGINQTKESEIFELLRRSHEGIKNSDKKIMVTHMHPRGSKAEIIGFEGSKAIRKAIEKFHPDILITAHIHEAGGLQEKIGKTRVINVSRKPTIFEI